MKEQLNQIRKNAEERMANAADLSALEEIRINFLGKKGELTAVLKGMGGLTAEERPIIGQLANEVRSFIENSLDTKKAEFEAALEAEKLANETIDVTMPGKAEKLGKKHPLFYCRWS